MKYLYTGLAGLILAGAAFYAGYSYHEPETVVETKVQEVEKVVTKTVRETVVVPGKNTTVTETVTEVRNVATNRSEATPSPVAKVPVPHYSLGLVWHPSTLDKYTPSGVEFGYRVMGPVWGTATWDWQEKSALLGLRVMF